MVWSGLTSHFLSYPDRTGKELINFLASHKNTNPILEGFILAAQLLPKGPTSYYTGPGFQSMRLKDINHATHESTVNP